MLTMMVVVITMNWNKKKIGSLVWSPKSENPYLWTLNSVTFLKEQRLFFIFTLSKLQQKAKKFFFQNHPKVRWMPIRCQYVPHLNLHLLLVWANLDILPPERILIASSAQELQSIDQWASSRRLWACAHKFNLMVGWNSNGCSTGIPGHRFQYPVGRSCITIIKPGLSRKRVKGRTRHSELQSWMISLSWFWFKMKSPINCKHK